MKRFHSYMSIEPGGFSDERNLRLDNSGLSPEEAVEMIVRLFGYGRTGQ
ncbi:MAG: hypothetical protein PUC00_08660 [Clostridiales bacterium]|nr:hypothetical protein [Clostridiales bacterium]